MMANMNRQWPQCSYQLRPSCRVALSFFLLQHWCYIRVTIPWTKYDSSCFANWQWSQNWSKLKLLLIGVELLIYCPNILYCNFFILIWLYILFFYNILRMHKSLLCIACYIGLVLLTFQPNTCTTTILFLPNENSMYVCLSSDNRCKLNPSL